MPSIVKPAAARSSPRLASQMPAMTLAEIAPPEPICQLTA